MIDFKNKKVFFDRECGITISPKDESFCPIAFLWNGGIMDGTTPCSKKCRWYATYYKGTENEYSGCAVESLHCLQDMI